MFFNKGPAVRASPNMATFEARIKASLRPLFSAKELQTLQPSRVACCPVCAQQCGATFRLTCSCVVCGNCLDDIVDNVGAGHFECPLCGGACDGEFTVQPKQ